MSVNKFKLNIPIFVIEKDELKELIFNKPDWWMTGNKEIYDNIIREEIYSIPKLVIRELIANALIHQDFAMTGTGTIIEFYSNRIEITKIVFDIQNNICLFIHKIQRRFCNKIL